MEHKLCESVPSKLNTCSQTSGLSLMGRIEQEITSVSSRGLKMGSQFEVIMSCN